MMLYTLLVKLQVIDSNGRGSVCRGKSAWSNVEDGFEDRGRAIDVQEVQGRLRSG